ncbi:chaperone modulator CbpM [Formosa haliotis]|uniref:chaperone modulator CbpM n=1 Tax=Formosa haliotis TaxID=1555194 RepID=UPI00082628DE|nr:chaperone modulator CbpM [Formosa haliotis]
MATNQYILVKTICVEYQIEPTFLDELHGIGLIEITTIENDQFLHQDKLTDLEKIIRLHNELHVNIEGIDVAFNLLQKVDRLQNELRALKNRLYFYENQ